MDCNFNLESSLTTDEAIIQQLSRDIQVRVYSHHLSLSMANITQDGITLEMSTKYVPLPTVDRHIHHYPVPDLLVVRPWAAFGSRGPPYLPAAAHFSCSIFFHACRQISSISLHFIFLNYVEAPGKLRRLPTPKSGPVTTRI